MEDKKDIKEVFLSRIQIIDPWIAPDVLSAIMSRHTPEQMERCLSKTDEYIRSVVDQTKRFIRLKSEADSPYSAFGTLGKLEMEIREILIWKSPSPVLLGDLCSNYHWRYNKVLQIHASFRQNQWNGMMQWHGMIECNGMTYNLSRLHTVLALSDSYGNTYMSLLDNVSLYQDQDGRNGANKIYITFRGRRLTPEDVWNYFRQYGIVTDVQIPAVQNCNQFGFVTFVHRQVVDLLLLERDSTVPHFIAGARVFAKKFKPRAERIPSDGQRESEHLRLLSSGGNEHCPHVLCEIITSRGICRECRKLLLQIMEVVRMREKCVECGKLLNQITESMRRSENCARCRQLLRQMIVCIQE